MSISEGHMDYLNIYLIFIIIKTKIFYFKSINNNKYMLKYNSYLYT